MIPFECLVADKCYFSQSQDDFKMRLKQEMEHRHRAGFLDIASMYPHSGDEKRMGHFVYVEEVKPNGDMVVLENSWQPIYYVKED